MKTGTAIAEKFRGERLAHVPKVVCDEGRQRKVTRQVEKTQEMERFGLKSLS
jgi:hypothetical protein